MAETVDTRVVEAKFDSKQFEQGVNKTVKKLDELKKSLNLKDSSKSIAELAEKTEEAADKASKSLEQLEQRFTSFTGMLKQKFISGIADEIIGVFFKIKSGFEGMIQSLTGAQASYGLQRYYDLLTSVRVMVSAGESQNKAYEVIGRLGQYADQTSYSLDQLVSTMSKFKTAGADIDTAQRMVEGLSNAAASMGVNAQDATRAYLNMQQAYSKGFMMQNDWISFESLPMVGTKFSQAIIDAAVKVGTLEEDKNKKGTYRTRNKTDKQVRTSGADATGITAENMGTKLSSKWFNKKVMEEVFGNTYYFPEVNSKEIEKIENAVEAMGKAMEDNDLTQQKMNDHLSKYVKDVTSDDIIKAYNDMIKKQEELNKEFEEGKITQDEKNNIMKDIAVDEYFEALTAVRIRPAQEKYNQQIAELDEQLKDNIINQIQYNKAVTEYKKELDEFVKANTITRFGYECFIAGQEARSFTDVLNTLKDIISRGWATSFELIIGKLDEAKKLFTWFTDNNLANAIYNIGYFRNAILEVWKGGEEDGGRAGLIQALHNIDDLLGNIFSKIGLISAEEDGESPWEERAHIIGRRLKELTWQFEEFTEKVKVWFTDPIGEGNESRLDRIGYIFSTIGSAITIVRDTIAVAWIQLKPTFEAILRNLDKITEPIFEILNPEKKEGVADPLNDISNAIKNIFKFTEPISKILPPIIDVLGDILKFAVEIGISGFTTNLQFISDTIGLITELIFGRKNSAQAAQGKGVLDGIEEQIKEIGEACKSALKFVGDFFSNLMADLRKLIGLDKDVNGEDGGLFHNLLSFIEDNEFIKSAKAWIDQAVIDVGNWIMDIPKKLAKIPSVIEMFIHNIFWKKETKTLKSGRTITREVRTELGKWLDQAKKSILIFIQSIPEKLKAIPSIISEFIHGFFYRKAEKNELDKANEKGEVQTALKDWLDGAIEAVKNFIQGIPGFITSIPSMIGSFFDSLFYKEETYIVGTDSNGHVKTATRKVNTGLKDWIDGVWNTVSNFITVTIPQKVKEFPQIVGQFIHDLFYVTEQRKDPSTGIMTEVEVETPLGAWVNKAIKEAKAFIADIPNKVKNIPSVIGEFVDSLFYEKKETSIANIGSTTVKVAKPFKQTFDNIAKAVGDALAELPNTLLGFFNTAIDEIGKLWENLYNSIKGEENKGSFEEDPAYIGFMEAGNTADAERVKKKYEEQTKSKWEGIVKTIGTTIANAFSHLGTWIAQGLDLATSGINNAVKWIADFFEKNSPIEQMGEALENDADEGAKKQSGFITAVQNIGTTIVDFITNTVPNFFIQGFNYVKENGTNWWKSITDIFEGSYGTISTATGNLGQYFEDRIKDISGTIQGAFNWVANTVFKKDTFDEDEYERWLMRFDQATADKEYKDKTQNPIYRFFKGLISGIGDLFKEIGPTIVDGIDTALTLIGRGLSSLTKTAEEAHDKGDSVFDAIKKKVTGEDGEQSKLQKSIVNLGETIKGFLTQTIPNFIEEAVKEISIKVPQIIGKLFGGGNQSETKNMVEEVVDEQGRVISETVKNAAEKNTAEGVDWFGDLLFGNMGLLGSTGKADSLVLSDEEMKELNDALFPKNISKELDEERNALLGKILSKTKLSDKDVEYLKNNSMISEELLAKILGTDKKAEDEVKSSLLDSLKEKMGSFGGIIDLISKFGNALGSLATSTLGQLVLFAIGLKLFISALSDLTGLSDEFEEGAKLSKWNAIKIAIEGLLILIGYISYLAANDTDTLTKTEQALNNIADWLQKMLFPIEIILGIVTGGKLFDMISSIADASKEKANNKENKTLDKAGKEIDKNSKNIAQKAGSWLGERGTNFIDSIFGSLGSALGDAVGAAGKTVATVGTGGLMAGFIGEIGELISANARDAFSNLGDGFKQLSGDLGDIVTNLEGITGKVVPLINTVGEVKDLLGAFFKLTFFTPEEIDKYGLRDETGMPLVDKYLLVSLRTMLTPIRQLAGTLTLFKEAVRGYEAEGSTVTALQSLMNMKDQMKEFGEFAKDEDGVFQSFKEGLASIGALMQLFSGSETLDLSKPLNDINIDGIIEVLQKLVTHKDFASLATQFNTETKDITSSELLSTSEKIIIFAGALSSIAKACAGLDPEKDKENIQALFTLVSGIQVTNDTTTISEITQQFGELGNALSAFAMSTADLTDTNLTNAERALKMLSKLAIDLKDTQNESFIAKLFFGDRTLGTFGQGVEQLGGHLKNFFESIENLDQYGNVKEYSMHNVSVVMHAVIGLAEAARILATSNVDALKALGTNLGDSSYLGGFKTFLTEIANMKNAADGISEDGLDFVDKVVSVIVKLAIACQKAVTPNFEGNFYEFEEVLLGNKGGGKSGFLWDFKQFLEQLNRTISKDNFDKETAIQFFESMAGMISALSVISSKMYMSKAEGQTSIRDNFENLITAIEYITEKQTTFKDFFRLAQTFSETGITSALNMFTAFNQLGQAINQFGSSGFSEGMIRLHDLDWSALRDSIEELAGVVNDMAYEKLELTPKIVPVIELTDDFNQKMESLKWLRGDDIGSSMARINADFSRQFQLPEQHNYSDALNGIMLRLDRLEKLDYLSRLPSIESNTASFNNSLSNFKVIINGQELVQAIGPQMDSWLGMQGYIAGRGTYGTSYNTPM